MAGKVIPSVVGLLAFLCLALSIADVALASYAVSKMQGRERYGSFWPPSYELSTPYQTVPALPTWLLVLRVDQTILGSAALGIVAGFCCLVATGPLLTSAIRKPTRTVWPMTCLVTSSVAMVITLAMFIYVFAEHYTSLQLPATSALLGQYLTQLRGGRIRRGRSNHMSSEAYMCQLAPAFSAGVAEYHIDDSYWTGNCRTLKAARWIMLPNLICLIGLVIASSVLVFRCVVARRKQGTNTASKEAHHDSVSTA